MNSLLEKSRKMLELYTVTNRKTVYAKINSDQELTDLRSELEVKHEGTEIKLIIVDLRK